jgi:hypothetical protein
VKGYGTDLWQWLQLIFLRALKAAIIAVFEEKENLWF